MRLSRDDYFMSMAILASMRSPCLSRQVGAVVVYKNHVVSTGYNGPPPNYPHCTVCNRSKSGKDLDDCPAIHAEANAIVRAIKGDTIYCTDQPCIPCLKLILTAGIKRIIYKNYYPASFIRHRILKESGIEEIKIKWRIPSELISRLTAI